MSNQSGEPEIYIEFSGQDGFQFANAEDKLEQAAKHSDKAMTVAMSAIKAMAKKVSANIAEFGEDIAPDEIAVEFGLKLELEGGVSGGAIIPWVSKATTGGQFVVKVKWNLERTKASTSKESPAQQP